MTEHKFQEVVGPFLRPGEHIECAAAGTLATPSVKRQVATAVAVSVATLGTFSGYAVGKGAIYVVTDQRLLVFDTNANANKPIAKLLGETERRGLQVEPAGGVISAKYDVSAPDGSALRITFAAMQRKAGKALIAALATAPAPTAPAPPASVARPAAKKAPAKKAAAKKAPKKS